MDFEIELSDAQIAHLAQLAVSPEWLTFTAVTIGGVEFVGNLSERFRGREVVFVHEGALPKPSGNRQALGIYAEGLLVTASGGLRDGVARG